MHMKRGEVTGHHTWMRSGWTLGKAHADLGCFDDGEAPLWPNHILVPSSLPPLLTGSSDVLPSISIYRRITPQLSLERTDPGQGGGGLLGRRNGQAKVWRHARTCFWMARKLPVWYYSSRRGRGGGELTFAKDYLVGPEKTSVLNIFKPRLSPHYNATM